MRIARWFLSLVVILFALTARVASATTYNETIPAGSGTLSYTAVATVDGQCGVGLVEKQNATPLVIGNPTYYYLTAFSSFSYTLSGVTTPLSGGGSSFYDPVGGRDGCVPSNMPPITLTAPGIDIVFTPNTSYTGYATVEQGATGYVNPKYVVVGVVYAPPGPNSSVTYANSTLVGSTTNTTSSFMNDVNVTVSVSKGISAWTIVGGAATTITNSVSTDSSQGSNSSQTVTLSSTVTDSDTFKGTANACSPVNHDYDYIGLWLNPLMIYSTFSNISTIQWNGYGYDPNDPSGGRGRDIFWVQVGWLNGDFGDDPAIDTVLARGWVTTYEPTITWPAGEGPGITSADKTNILGADPFTNPSYVLSEPLPQTSADGRFSQDPYPPNPITYIPSGLTTLYSSVDMDTQSEAQGASTSYKQAVGTDINLKGGSWFASFTIDIKTTDTLSWTNTWLDTLTVTQTNTNSFSITEPTTCTPAYSGPGQFIVYQDNLYGTFMSYPSN